VFERLLLYTDAGSRGNPGRTALAYAAYASNGVLLREEATVVDNTTNNRAEYLALIAGLEACAALTAREVRCLSDSELVVRQLNGEYRVRDQALKDLHRHVRHATRPFESVTFEHVPRTDPRIARADALLNKALDHAT
jgi:ribonuclease HI